MAWPCSRRETIEGNPTCIDVRTVGELRAVKRLPHPIDIFIPYRLKPDSAVVIARSR
jgi:hypothetical protein